jgi:hypothetical protein
MFLPYLDPFLIHSFSILTPFLPHPHSILTPFLPYPLHILTPFLHHSHPILTPFSPHSYSILTPFLPSLYPLLTLGEAPDPQYTPSGRSPMGGGGGGGGGSGGGRGVGIGSPRGVSSRGGDSAQQQVRGYHFGLNCTHTIFRQKRDYIYDEFDPCYDFICSGASRAGIDPFSPAL